MLRLIASALVVLAALIGATGCGDDDGDDDEAERYAIEVERVSDSAYEASQGALVALNEVADGSRSAAAAQGDLERSARDVQAQSEELASLAPPDEAASVADDLEFQLDSLSRAIDSAATDLVAGSGSADAARSGARVVLVAQSGMAALARALRTLAVEGDD